MLPPAHHQLPLGYPFSELGLKNGSVPLRIVSGGVLTGTTVDDAQLGLDGRCRALNVLEEMTEREVLAFVQPGFTKRSYSNTFAKSVLQCANSHWASALKHNLSYRLLPKKYKLQQGRSIG